MANPCDVHASDDLQRLRPLLLAVLTARRHLGAARAAARSRSFRQGLTSLERQRTRLAAELALTMLSLGAPPEIVGDQAGDESDPGPGVESDVGIATSVLLLERRVLAAYDRALAQPLPALLQGLVRRHLVHVADACEELEAFRRVLDSGARVQPRSSAEGASQTTRSETRD